jgi:hypothetical protein
MRIIAIEKEIGKPGQETFAPHLRAETLQVLELQQQDILREIYFRADKHEAVLILECKNVDAAREALDTLPLVQHGLIDFEIIPLKPYSGFLRLVEGELG